MFQSSFTGLKPLQKNSSYVGGFCKFWYIPVEYISVFPRVGASDQQLVDEPAILPDTFWFGPIVVPKDKLGFSEQLKRTKAGPYYENKVEGIHIGDSVESRVNIENMAYHRYLVVGKVRAGGFFMLIGSVDSPCRFDTEYKTGNGPGETAQTNFVFSTEHISKAYIMPSFIADQQAPGAGSGGGGNPSMANQKEVIPFVNQSMVNIPWTPTRMGKFGSFPLVEVWIDDGVEPPFLNIGAAIEVDQPPPAFTELNVNLGLGAPSGFIVIG